MHTIHSMMFSAATSLNAFWILNIVKETSPAFKTFLNFYPVTGPLLGLYIASILVLIVSFALARPLQVGQTHARRIFSEWYFILSVIMFFLAVFPPVYGPIVALLL